ncbi:hypothetical protein DFH29DRAFT_1010202 [Suillus ampliporus]|nr:hypothetical protein DFH29DRAFT_1010202 [Suillus ampliporus]
MNTPTSSVKMKDQSSAKTANISAHLSPMGTRQPLPRHHRSGSQFFPPNVLTDEGDTSTEIASTPSTPSPTPKITIPPKSAPEPSTTPITTPKPSLSPTTDMEDETPPTPPSNSPPYPQADTDDEVMSDHSPPTDQPDLPETNRSIIRSNGVNSLTVIPQFTPIPQGRFPHIHLAHAAQLFDFQAAKVITAWLKVPHPKILIRVFDYDGKNPSMKGPILMNRKSKSHLHAQKTTAPESDRPLSFLAYNISEETKTLILNQCIWSSMDISFAAHQFSVKSPPLLLFCLHGFSTTDTNTVKSAVHNTWTEDMTRWDIGDILSECEITEEKVHIAAWDLINSLWIEHLDFKASGSISLPCYNIFAMSPTSNPTKAAVPPSTSSLALSVTRLPTHVDYAPSPMSHSGTVPSTMPTRDHPTRT